MGYYHWCSFLQNSFLIQILKFLMQVLTGGAESYKPFLALVTMLAQLYLDSSFLQGSVLVHGNAGISIRLAHKLHCSCRK